MDLSESRSDLGTDTMLIVFGIGFVSGVICSGIAAALYRRAHERILEDAYNTALDDLIEAKWDDNRTLLYR